MPKVPELTGLMVAPAGARQGNFQYSQVNPDQTVAKTVADVDDKANAIMGLRAREEKKAAEKAKAEADKAKKAMDTAKAGDLLFKLGKRVQAYLLSENGPLRTQGVNVVKGVDGQPFSDYHLGQLETFMEELAGEAEGNEEVLSRYRSGAQTILGNAATALYRHEGDQGRAYIVTTQENSVAAAQTDFAAYPTVDKMNVWKAETEKLASLNGLDTKDPNFQRQMSASAGEIFTTSFASRVKNNDLGGAKNIYLAAVESGTLTLRQKRDAELVLKAAADAEDAAFVGEQIAAEIVAQQDPSRILFGNVYGSAEAKAPARLFTEAGVNYDEVARRGYGKDKSYTAAVNADLVNRISQTTGTTEETVGVVVLGRDRVEQAKAAAEKDLGSASLWMKKITPGEFASVNDAVKKGLYSDAGVMTGSAGNILKRAQELLPGRDSAVVAAAATAATDNLATRQARQKQDREVGLATFMDRVDAGGDLNDPSLAAYTNLFSQQDKNTLQLYRERAVTGDQTTDRVYYTKLIGNPWRIKSMSEAELRLQKAYLGPKEYGVLVDQWRRLQNVDDLSKMDTPRDQVATAVKMVLRDVAPKLLGDDEASKMRREALIDSTLLDILAVQRENAGNLSGTGGVKFSSAELYDVVRKRLVNTFKTPGWTFGSGENKNIAELKRKDLPSPVVNLLTSVAKAQGVVNPSDTMLVNLATSAVTQQQELPGAAEAISDNPRVAEAARRYYAKQYAAASGASASEAEQASRRMTDTQVISIIVQQAFDGNTEFAGMISDTYADEVAGDGSGAVLEKIIADNPDAVTDDLYGDYDSVTSLY